MAKRVLLILLLAGMATLFFRIISGFDNNEEISDLAYSMVTEAPLTLNTQNVITAIVVSMRGLDTLGEVAVLFIAASGVGFLLRRREKPAVRNRRNGSEILQTGSKLLLPVIILFGVYIFTHGHLTPGGGFQGGVVIASAFLLTVLADVSAVINHRLLSATESLSGFFYVLLGITGFLLGGGILDSRFLPPGHFGTLVSAGAIPLIYSFIGLKVGTELTGIVLTMEEENTK
jgi:multicomponent Na+:H+ antiporter subunit B